jgi:hypothetical protein
MSVGCAIGAMVQKFLKLFRAPASNCFCPDGQG